MTVITCPYPWDCGKTFEIEKLNKHDVDFLQSATEKKMTFMILHCPECLREFKFDTVQWVSDQFGYSDPNIVVQKKKKTNKQLSAILMKANIEIPSSYFNVLSTAQSSQEISIFADEAPFTLYALDELCEKIDIDGKLYLTVSQLKGYVNTLKTVGISENEYKEELSLSELSACITIGFENTRLLFLDPRDHNSLWIFDTDGGGELEKTSLTLDHILKQIS